MATTQKGSFQSPVTKEIASTPTQLIGVDATELLTQDHNEARALFRRFQSLTHAAADGRTRQTLAEKICHALVVHTTIEEEIFYPAARAAQLGSELMDEARVEHDAAKSLISQILTMSPDDPLYNAKVNVLGEYVDLHATEEEREMFPKARRSQMDLEALAAQLRQRKAELTKLQR